MDRMNGNVSLDRGHRANAPHPMNGNANGHTMPNGNVSNHGSNLITNQTSNQTLNQTLNPPTKRKVRSATSSPPVAVANVAANHSNRVRNGMTSSKSKPLLVGNPKAIITKQPVAKAAKHKTIATKLKVQQQSHHQQQRPQQSHLKGSRPHQSQHAKSLYKYGGTGYDVWRKNGQIALWTETELYCLKTFGKNGNDRAKLKRFLIKKGGFKAAAIKFVKPQSTKYPNNTFHFAFITVQDSLSEIKKCVARLNAVNEDSPQEIIRINRRKCSRGTTQCTCLFVTNFDILTKDDHRHFTDLFVQFGPLEKDVFMNRSSNGVNYAFVRFRKLEDALRCYHNQNDESWQAEPLYFNDRKLQIGFDEKGGRTQNR